VKNSILVLGAGNVGLLVASLLSDTQDYTVYLGDIQKPSELPDIEKNPIQFVLCNIDQQKDLIALIKKYEIQTVVSCLPFQQTEKVAELAASCQLNYFDLTEDVEMTTKVSGLAEKSQHVFAPQCGLAPGFISVVASYLMKPFDKLGRIKLRVGALPLNVSNPLNYALTWSTPGLINEYINPCAAIVDYKKAFVQALDNLEEIKLDGLTYEAFNTSGGVGSLVDTYEGKVRHMDYKSVRYPGHCEKMRFLLQGLKLSEDPEKIYEILENAVPKTASDVVLVYVSVQGIKDDVSLEHNYAEKFYPVDLFGRKWTAIQMTTASSLCVAIDLVVVEKKYKGPLLKQEQINFKEDFLPNRFGQYFQREESQEGL
jgi:saccharopine dehydrogenase-like NADP-dependent oxidoreductase